MSRKILHRRPVFPPAPVHLRLKAEAHPPIHPSTPMPLLPTLLLTTTIAAQPAPALPPPEDQPEEVLRTEVITEARSPVDGKPLTAREYAELQAREEAARENLATVSPEVRRVVNQLRLRRTIRTFFPFLIR